MMLDALVFGHEKKSSTRTCTQNSFSVSADAHHDRPSLPDLSAQQDHHIAKYVRKNNAQTQLPPAIAPARLCSC
jgi:hypothetical protein